VEIMKKIIMKKIIMKKIIMKNNKETWRGK